MKFYTIDCPRCDILQEKMEAKGLSFETIKDEQIFSQLGITQFPVLEVNGELLEFSAANKYINSLGEN